MKGNPVVAAVVMGVFIIAAILIYRYTSPYEQCIRSIQSQANDTGRNPYIFCARAVSNR